MCVKSLWLLFSLVHKLPSLWPVGALQIGFFLDTTAVVFDAFFSLRCNTSLSGSTKVYSTGLLMVDNWVVSRLFLLEIELR